MKRTWFIDEVEFTGSMVSTWKQWFGVSGKAGAWTLHDRRDDRPYEGRRRGFVSNQQEVFWSLEEMASHLLETVSAGWLLANFDDQNEPSLVELRHWIILAGTDRSRQDLFVEAVLLPDEGLADACGRGLIRAAHEDGDESGLRLVADGVLLRDEDVPTHVEEAPEGSSLPTVPFTGTANQF